MTELMQQNAAGEADGGRLELAGKYLTFRIGSEEYGVEILKVQEIIKMQEITYVPRTPAYMKGVINLRGQVIPVVELRVKFCMESAEYDQKTCIIVTQIKSEASGTMLTIGMVVDEVSEVMDIPAAAIEPPPNMGSGQDSDFILGMAKVKKRVAILLDIDRILSGNELIEMEKL